MKENYVTLEEFKEQVWKIEHVKINISNKDIDNMKSTILIKSYPYTTPYNGDGTVNEFLADRINPCLIDTIQPKCSFTIKL